MIAAADLAWAQFVSLSVSAARAQLQMRCVDGLIIGTGQADFTENNTTFTLHHEGRSFLLVDVPGIEGHEQRFASLVSRAIAKAHLVFYVNGTNKKPEATTVRKIQSYLGRGTQVCALVNVKEYADGYEFEEDRIDLSAHAGAGGALQQTEGVLLAALKPDLLLRGQCVQGLLAFSALALESPSGRSTVHQSRSHDLGVHQRKYIGAFGSVKAMRTFSRIDDVAAILTAKAQTFQEDIVEANKTKVRELLVGTLGVLDATRKDHQAFMVRVQAELVTSTRAVDQALTGFARLALGARQSQINHCFGELERIALENVREHFGDNAAISKAVEQALESEQEKMVSKIESALEALLGTLEQDLLIAVERLLQNLQRAELERQIAQTARLVQGSFKFTPIELEMGLGLLGWSTIVTSIAGMAVSGAQIGLTFPPWGPFIGASAGLIVGAALSLVGVFSSHAAKVRKAQGKMQQRLSTLLAGAQSSALLTHDRFMAELRGVVDIQVRGELDRLQANLAQPGQLVEQQIKVMSRILRKVEEMPYGTVQAVRH